MLTQMLSGASRPFVSWAVPGIWFAMISHVERGSQQQLCCKFDACAATLDATDVGHLLSVDSASCSCECVVSSTWMPSSAWFDVVLRCDDSSFVPVPPSLSSVQYLSEVAPGWCIELALMFQVSEFGFGEDELKNPVSEIVPGWPVSAFLADVVRAATLFMFTPVCFQFFKGSDGGLGPRFLKLSGPALLVAMFLLRPCMLHGILGGEFFRLLSAPVKCSSGRLKGRNEGKAEKDKTSTPLYQLFSLQVFSGRDGPAAVVAAAFQFLFMESASFGAAAASTCALKLVDSGFGILEVQVHVEVLPLQEVLSHTLKEVLALVLNGVFLWFFHYVSVVLFCIAAAAFQRLVKVVLAYLSAASTAAAFVLPEVFVDWTSMFVSASPLRGHVLGLRMIFPQATRLGADKVLLQVSGSFWRFAALYLSDLVVLRCLVAERAGAACDGVSGVAGINGDHGVDMSVIALPRIKGMQSFRVDAGTRPHIALMAKAEATPRVDVGGVSTTLMVSRGERQNRPAGYQVFARVDGKTLVIQVWEEKLISDLRALIACRLHASPDQCYVTKGGKMLSLMSSVHEVGLVKGSTVELHARGVGGGAVPGEWYCNHCQRGGCWPARSHCFRCGLPRGEVGSGKGGKAKGKGGTPPRETSYPGKSSSTAARVQAGKKGWSSKLTGENSIPVSISPDVVSQLLNLLQNLGVSQQVMGEIRTKTSQASQKARVVPARTRRVAEMEEKWLKSASHLENLREQMTRKEQEYLASLARFEEQEKVVVKLEAEYREAKNLLVTPVPSDHSDEGSAGEKEGSDGGLVSDMEVQDVEDMGELHDLDLISGDTCKGDPPPDPKRVRTEPPKTKAPPPISPSPKADRDMLLAAIKMGVLSRDEIAEAMNFNMQLALCPSSGSRGSG